MQHRRIKLSPQDRSLPIRMRPGQDGFKCSCGSLTICPRDKVMEHWRKHLDSVKEAATVG